MDYSKDGRPATIRYVCHTVAQAGTITVAGRRFRVFNEGEVGVRIDLDRLDHEVARAAMRSVSGRSTRFGGAIVAKRLAGYTTNESEVD